MEINKERQLMNEREKSKKLKDRIKNLKIKNKKLVRTLFFELGYFPEEILDIVEITSKEKERLIIEFDKKIEREKPFMPRNIYSSDDY